MKSISVVLHAGVCAACLFPSSAAAQAGAAAQDEGVVAARTADRQPTGEPVDTTDIVVTAQKREERLLDVPISVVAINGDRLQRLNLSTATDLQFVTPGLGLGDSNTPRGAGLRIRGVGTTVFADGVEQSVGTVVDGIPLARAGQGLAELVDVERVEVLRGPQGMLFGRNASAGLINIVTQLPTEDLSFTGNASYASQNEIKLGGSLSGALIPETVSARVTGFLNRRDGFVTNLTTGNRLNNQNEYGARGVVEIKPASGVQFILRGDWAKRDTRCCIWTARSFASAGLNPAGTLLLANFVDPRVRAAQGPGNRIVAQNGDPFNKGESYGFSGEINVDLSGYTLTSLTGYRHWSQFDGLDSDQSTLNVLDVNYGSNELKQVTQELRITSPKDRLVEFVAGLFYFDATNDNFSRQQGRFAVSLAAAQAGGVAVPLAPGLVLPAAQNFGRDITTRIGTRDYAAFGQATINFSDRFRGIVGGRFTRTRVYLDYQRAGTPGASSFNFVLGSAFANIALPRVATRDDNLSFRLGLQFDLNPNANIFATVSRGYKGPGLYNGLDVVLPPGISATSPAQLETYLAVRPEIPTSYEIGYKASYWDRRVSLSLSAYWTEFKDFQAQVVETPPGQTIGAFAVRNAGKLRSRGFEAELNFAPTRGLSIGMGLSYNDATFLSFRCAARPRGAALAANPACTTIGTGVLSTFDASGQPATNAPRITATFNPRYETSLGQSGLKGFIESNVYYRDKVTFQLVPNGSSNPYVQPDFAIVNGSVGIVVGGRYTISAFVKNLFDQNYVTSIFDLPLDANGGLGQFVTRDSERTIGGSIRVRF